MSKVGEKSSIIFTQQEHKTNTTEKSKELSGWEKWNEKYGAGATIHDIAGGGYRS